MRPLTRRSVLLGAGGLLAGGLAGCSPGSVPRPESTESSSPTPSGPVVDEPALSSLELRKLWSAPERTKITDLATSAIRDGILYAEALSSTRGVPRFQVIELASGAVRWTSADAEAAVRRSTRGTPALDLTTVLGGSGGSTVVLGTIHELADASVTTSVSVVALSATDGSVRWVREVVAPINRTKMTTMDEDSAIVVAADGDSVVAATGSMFVISGKYSADDRNPCRTVVLEAATGRERWRVEDLLPVAMSDDVVITIRPTGRARALRDPFTEVVALDLRTGRRRWSTADRLERARVVITGPRALVLQGGDARGNPGRQRLVGSATGVTVGDPLPAAAGTALLGETADGQPLVAWTNDGEPGPILSMTSADPTQRRSARSPFSRTNLIGGQVQGGYVWCSDSDAMISKAVDRSGHDCSDAVPGYIVAAVDDDHLVMLHRGLKGAASKGFTVYAIS